VGLGEQAVVFGVINAFIRPVAKILTFPLIIVTLGIFALVVNGLMLWLTASLSEGLGLGFRVQVPADAVGSRHKIDWEFALRRLEHAGVIVSTSEAVLFEWIENADRPEFKSISEIVKSRINPENRGRRRIIFQINDTTPSIVTSHYRLLAIADQPKAFVGVRPVADEGD
jgi:hypothetical protein